MKKNKTRRIVLLSSVLLFFCIYVILLVAGSGSGVRKISVKGNINSIVIEKQDETIDLYLDGETWMVGKDGDQAVQYYAQTVCDMLSELKVIGTASNSVQGNEKRYGLDPENAIRIIYSTDRGNVREILVGKETSTGSQNYLLVGSEEKVGISSDRIGYWVSKSGDDFIQKTEADSSENGEENIPENSMILDSSGYFVEE